MIVTRSKAEGGPATLTVFFDGEASRGTVAASSQPSSTAAAGSEAADAGFGGERTEVIDMKDQHESEILKRVMELTGATPVSATAEEVAEMEELGVQQKRSAQDRMRMAKVNEQKRQEQALLDQARGTMAA